jgi:hypothetical protein
VVIFQSAKQTIAREEEGIKLFSRIMMVGQEFMELILLLSVESQPTKAVLAQTYMDVFLIFSVCV